MSNEMEEWTVVTVIVVLSGLVISFVKPLMTLNSTLTRLTDAVAVLEKEVANLAVNNGEAHSRLWEKEREQDILLQEHEKRISKIETA